MRRIDIAKMLNAVIGTLQNLKALSHVKQASNFQTLRIFQAMVLDGASDWLMFMWNETDLRAVEIKIT